MCLEEQRRADYGSHSDNPTRTQDYAGTKPLSPRHMSSCDNAARRYQAPVAIQIAGSPKGCAGLYAWKYALRLSIVSPSAGKVLFINKPMMD